MSSVELELEPRLLPDLPEVSDARRRLYEAAIALFGDGGYHSVSVRDLAGSLGMAPAALYAHVPSKQHLLFELVMIGHREHRDRLVDALLGAGPDPADQVRAITRAHVQVHLEFAAMARVTRDVKGLSPEQLDEAGAIRRESEQLLHDVIDRGVRLGAFDVADTRVAVLSIAAMGVRAADWWTEGDTVPGAQVADQIAEFAVRLLRKA